MAIVVLVGRPNVGKSALFNRMTESRRAIVENVPGVTRDRLYEETTWNGQSFTLVDTGGVWLSSDNEDLLNMTLQQTEIAIKEAQVIVLVVDGQAGPTSSDFDVLDIVRKTRKPVILAVNKAEGGKIIGTEFYEFGLGVPVPVSAVHGEGTGDLLDRIVENLPVAADDESQAKFTDIRIALAGRPNVGKSSLLNTLTGEERTLVTPIPGTTRDVVDSVLEIEGQRYIILDTAGLRRPNKISDKLEEKTVQRTLDAIRKSDVVLLMLYANEPVTGQDQRIAGQIHKAGKGVVVLLNKSDLIKGTTIPVQNQVREALKFLDYARVIPVSVLTQWHLEKIWPAITEAFESYSRRIPTHQLNQLFQEAVHLNPPPTDKGRNLKVFYGTQVSNKPPHFVLFVNDPELVHFSYLRYLENRLREKFEFHGSPLQLSFRSRSRRDQSQ